MKRTKRLILTFCSLLAFGPLAARPAGEVRLVVQIVVGSMRPDDLTRYADRFGTEGFRRLQREGITYTRASYDCQQTLTVTSLATLTTGCMPSTHGVVTPAWYDYVENRRVLLIEDPSVEGLEYHTGGGNFSPVHLVAPAVSESLVRYSPESRVVTVALEPESAVVMGGRAGMTFWMNDELCHWRSSSCYLPLLPEWVKRYNREKTPQSFIMPSWSALYDTPSYHNDRRSDILLRQPVQPGLGGLVSKLRPKKDPATVKNIPCDVVYRREYDRLIYTPAGNAAVFNFAKTAMAQLDLGKDTAPDLLNICLDAPRRIVEAYGPESIEAEDMYYRLDQELADFLTFVYAQVPQGAVAVVLTSDHGTSDSYDAAPREQERFNVPQFRMILESFLDARYGKEESDWVLDCENKMIYLNHNLIYSKHLSLAEMQNEVATFAMQFRGVSHALSATAMRTSYFGRGYAEKMQNSFYPRRSGDVILNLMPGWIEVAERVRSASGSMYGYDTRVPLIVSVPGVAGGRTDDGAVEMGRVAPTVAQLLGVPAPSAADTMPLPLTAE